MTDEQDITLMMGFMASHLGHPHDDGLCAEGLVVYPDAIEIRSPWTGTQFKLTLTKLETPPDAEVGSAVNPRRNR
jgi:hypothetical protein